MRPGASFGAVCPPAFMVPTGERVVAAIVPAKDDAYHLHVSALDRELYLLDVFLPSTPFGLDLHAGIGGLDGLLAHHKPLISSGAVHSPQ